MLKLLVRLILKVLYRVQVRGHLPEDVPERLLIVANHQSFIDAFLLGALLPYKPTWVVHTAIWKQWYFRIIIRWQPHVIVDTAKPQAVRTLVREIEKGRPVVVFPEGRVTVTGGLMKVYDGPAFLAARTGAAILPVSIDGAVFTCFSRMKAPYPRKLFPRITLTVFPLTYIPIPQARTGRLRRRIASGKMHRLLEEIRFQSRARQTLYEAILNAIALYGRRTTILDDVQKDGQSFGNLLKSSLALGRLTGRLAAEGEIVGVLMPNAGVTIALLIGMFATRRIPAMLNYSSGVEGMRIACTAARIKTVLTSRAFLEKARLTDKVLQLHDIELVYLEDLRRQFSLRDKLWLLAWALWFPRSVMRDSIP